MYDTPRYRFHGRAFPRGDRTPLNFAEPGLNAEETTAKLRIYDPIDSWGGIWGVSAKEVAEALDRLPDSVEEITLHLNSPGGEVFEGIAILNTLRSHRARVVAVVEGLAASIASVIACGADELVMAPNSELMIHDAWGICVGNAGDMRKLADTLDHLSDNVAGVYARKGGGELADWRALMLEETWFGADEAVEAGLADRVGSGAADDPQARAHFDLAGLGFKHAGRAVAPAPKAKQDDTATPAAESADAAYRARKLAFRQRTSA